MGKREEDHIHSMVVTRKEEGYCMDHKVKFSDSRVSFLFSRVYQDSTRGAASLSASLAWEIGILLEAALI